MQRKLREGRLDRRKRALVPLDAEVGVVAALQHDLRRTEVDRLAAALDDVIDAAHPPFLRFRRPVEGAETAGGDTDVGVVDIPIDEVRGDVLGAGEAAAAHGVRGGAELMEGGVLIEGERLSGVDTPSAGSVVQDISKAHPTIVRSRGTQVQGSGGRKRTNDARGGG